MNVINKRLGYGNMVILGLLFFSCILLIFNVSRLNNIAYYETVETSVVECRDFSRKDSLLVQPGTGSKVFSTEVLLDKGDLLLVSFSADNFKDNSPIFYVDLYTSEYDYNAQEFMCTIEPGKNVYSGRLPYYRSDYPDRCSLRIFTLDEEANVEITDLSVDRQSVVRDNNQIVQIVINTLLAVFCVICFIFLKNCIGYAKEKSLQKETDSNRDDNSGIKRLYLLMQTIDLKMFIFISIVILLVLLWIYHDADICYPLIFSNGDEMSILYFMKTIKDFGISLVNSMTGGLSGGDQYDFPFSEILSFLLVRLISLFTDNIYLIMNLFYFSSYFFVAYSSAYVFRKLEVERKTASIISVLYAFSPFIQLRYAHMWLVPYYMLPFACLIAIRILQGTVYDKQQSLKNNQKFYQMIVLSFFCALTGLYYAYFSCALFAAAFLINIVNHQFKGLKQQLYPLAYILSTITGVVVSLFPNILYILINGENLSGELAIRGRADPEIFGLKMVQMLLPRIGHRISPLSKITEMYSANYPLINENSTASLGMVASIGFIILILVLLSNHTKYKEISCLNMACFLIATIGGGGSILSVIVRSPVRSYNRMSVIIMFLSLLMIGKLVSALKERISLRIFCVLLGSLLIFGVYDQTTTYVVPDYSEFEEARRFVWEIEEKMNEEAVIFQLPYGGWPSEIIYKNFIGYLESDHLRWSYGAMQGREEAVWQQQVASAEAGSMLVQLKEAGYSGIYLDLSLFIKKYGQEQAIHFLTCLQNEISNEAIVSEYGNIYFWDIRNL